MTRVLEYIELETPAWLVTSPMGDDLTWRFTKPTEATPKDILAIPSVRSISFTPATISLGENLGTRATLTVTFADHRHIMASESYDAGTFWGKWRGRFGQRLRGKPLRWIRGTVGQTLDEMETWHFVVEAVNGPTPDGTYTITAQDVLKLADDDRSLAPRPTRGILLADIDTDDTSITLGPTGIGAIDYPASGFVNIAGKEICAFTRSGDTLTITRNTTVPGTTFETEVAEHKAGARVQLCLPYIADAPDEIIADLFTNYAGIDADYIDTDAWAAETDAYLQTLYTTLITEPTGVNKLVTELIQQAGLAVWWDALEQTMRLQVLRAVPTTAAEFNEDKFLRGSLRTQDQPGKRISEVLVYYGLREPLKPVDEDDNYRAALLTPDPTAATEYNGIVTKTIKSRWVPFGAEQVAERLSLIQLGRYRDPPRKLSFDTWRFAADVPELGQGYQFGWTENQDSEGNAALAPIQVTRLNPMPERYGVEAEEALFTIYEGSTPGGLNNRTIIITSNINNVNLRDMHDSIYPEITDDDVSASPTVTLTCIINNGVIVGSTSTSNPAFDVGDWPTGFVPKLILNGRIQGRGGNGGSAPPSSNGLDGGPALYTRNDIDVEYGANAEIWGGGGGGFAGAGGSGGDLAGFGGGGGAGQLPGAGGVGGTTGSPPISPENGSPGTTEAGGPGSDETFGGIALAGDGGGPGQDGEDASFGGFVGGTAGAAIDGVSFVNVLSGSADVRGGQIN
jgi:hypothetical protein